MAAFIVDSFSGRGIAEIYTDLAKMPHTLGIVDAYRALDVLAKNPAIDPHRIAVMGYSRGGFVSLYASLNRFQRAYGRPGLQFAAFIPFYAPCNRHFNDGDDMSDRPIRLFHGKDDDWSRASMCREYVAHAKSLGKDITLAEYDDAGHSFDIPRAPSFTPLPNAENPGACISEETSSAEKVNHDTGKPLQHQDKCFKMGAALKYDATASEAATEAVKTFLTQTFHLSRGN